jgi:hypothetical protein
MPEEGGFTLGGDGFTCEGDGFTLGGDGFTFEGGEFAAAGRVGSAAQKEDLVKALNPEVCVFPECSNVDSTIPECSLNVP